MQNVKKKGFLLVLFGLSTGFIATLFTTAFVTKYISPDHSILTDSIALFHACRLLGICLGIFITITGIFAIVQDGKLKPASDWLINRLKMEQVLVGIILIGGFTIRFLHLVVVGIASPYKYGGLYLEFANQIAKNGFLLPRNIPFYSSFGIPFAYPPLPFYIEAIAIHRLGVHSYVVVNMLPPFISILALASFYILARVAELKKWQVLTALTAFAFMPNAFDQQIEGGGLAESFGTLALIWFLISLFNALKNSDLFSYSKIGVAWAFCIVSSPGSAYASILCFVAFSIGVVLRGRGNLGNSILRLTFAGVTALALSSPYWLSVIYNHGVIVFLDSLHGQNTGFFQTIINSLVLLLNFQIVSNSYAFLWNFLLLVGIVSGFRERKFLLLILFIIFASIPREGIWMLSIPSALLIGTGVDRIIPLEGNGSGKMGENKLLVISVYVLMVLWVAIGPLTTVASNSIPADSSLDVDVIKAMQWLRLNTKSDSHVIVISEPLIQEWLPQISQRTVINEHFGLEWQPDKRLTVLRMETALSICEDFDCVLASSHLIPDINHDHFLLFADKGKLENLAKKKNSETEFHLLWKNEKIGIGMLCKIDSCP